MIFNRWLVNNGQHFFGWALVTGKKRVPKPATGITAFLILTIAKFFDYFFNYTINSRGEKTKKQPCTVRCRAA